MTITVSRNSCLIVVLLLVSLSHAFAAPGMPQGESISEPLVVQAQHTQPLSALLARTEHRLILVGETHDNWADHQLQLAVIQQLHRQGRKLQIGLEWFQQPFQAALDAFSSGQIDEAELLRRSEYYRRWRFDYRLIRDILLFARANQIPLLALNADKELTDQVMQLGLDGLPSELRKQLPAQYLPANTRYQQQIKAAMGMHPDMPVGDTEFFQRFLEVQLSWDESMAARAAAAFQSNPDSTIVVLAGRGHTHRAAIPERFAARTDQSTLSIARYEQGSPFDDVDHWVMSPSESLPKAGALGVELIASATGHGVLVSGFSSASQAEAAGLQIGDHIVALNNTPIEDYVDVKMALLNVSPGDMVRVVALRGPAPRPYSKTLHIPAI